MGVLGGVNSMAIEIERKFLVSHNGWRRQVCRRHQIRQAYLSSTNQSTTRVRVIDECQAVLTVKSGYRGLARHEFEYTIPCQDAHQLIELRTSEIVEKTRHYVTTSELTWEVDEFLGSNSGLVIAEVELDDEGIDVQLPDWVGEEVTGQKIYHNSQLAIRPFSTWPDRQAKRNRIKPPPHSVAANLTAA